jgi:hypothetical protein
VYGANTASGYAGDLENLEVNGTSEFRVDAAGNVHSNASYYGDGSHLTGVAASGLAGATGTPANGQFPIGNGTNYTLATLTGTANEVIVTNGAGSITLTTPQAIGTGSTTQFAKESIGTASLGTSTILGVNAPTTADNAATAMIASTSATNKGLVVQGAASQSADFQDWETSAGTVDYSLNSTGTPSANTDLVTKSYVTTAISGVAGLSGLTTNDIPYATSATTLGNTTMSWSSANQTLTSTGVASASSLSLPTAATTSNVSTLTVGTAISGNTGGSMVGVNAPSGYGGDLANFQLNGTSESRLDKLGNLTTAGQIRSLSSANSGVVYNNSATAPATVIDWNNGNVQTTAMICDGSTATPLNHMYEGGSYTLIVTGSATGLCSFTTSSQTPATTTTWRYVPANAAPTSATQTVYTFLVAGGNAYISWITGF